MENFNLRKSAMLWDKSVNKKNQEKKEKYLKIDDFAIYHNKFPT